MSIRQGNQVIAGSISKETIKDQIESIIDSNICQIDVINGITSNETSVISLGGIKLTSSNQIISINLGNTMILPSLYTLSSDGLSVIFDDVIDSLVSYSITYIKKFELGSGSYINNHNVGDIFYTCRTDKTLNGSVECDGSTYNINNYSGKDCIGNLLNLKKIPYVSFIEYDALLNKDGYCKFFAWDGDTDFKVPTIPALLLSNEQAAVVGNGMTLGLTNGSQNGGLRLGTTSNTALIDTSLYGTQVGTSESTSSSLTRDISIGITTDPTKSGVITNLNTIQYRAMVQLATCINEISIETYKTELDNKATECINELETIKNSVWVGCIGDIKYTSRIGEVPMGGLWTDGSTHNSDKYPNLWNLLIQNKLHVLPIDRYNEQIELNGVCGYFGLDINNKTFRVPLLEDVYIKVGGEDALPEFNAESLPNILGSITGISETFNTGGSANGCFTRETGHSIGGTPASADSSNSGKVYFNASLSSSTYQDGAKVNPNNICYRAYVIVYNGIEEVSLVDYTNDLENFINEKKEELSETYFVPKVIYWD